MKTRRTPFAPFVIFAVVVAACGGSTATTATSATTVTTTTTLGSTTTSATTTTTTATVPLGSGPGYDEFGVAHVYKTDADGGLLIQPSGAAGNTPLGVALPNASGLFPTGNTSLGTGNATWYEVTHLGVTGYVHEAYLVELPSFAAYPCATDPGAYVSGSPLPALAAPTPVAGGTTADHVYSLNHMSSAACERTVITFGFDPTGGASFDLLDGDPAENLPVGGIIDAIQEGAFPGLWNVRFTGSMTKAAQSALEVFASDNGVVDAFVVRDDPFTGAASIDLKFSQNRAARAYWVSNPLRLVIDTVPAPTGNGMDIAAVMGMSMATPTRLINLEHPIDWDVMAPGVQAPITVRGWSRPFEAQLGVTLRTAPLAAGAPGSGTLATADVTYDLGGVTSQSGISMFGVQTTDYIDMWGRFEFTIDAIAPGDYELEFDDYGSSLYHQFTVVP